MDLDAHYKGQRWPENRVRGPLTDRKIEQYRKLGYYSESFREARHDLMEMKKARRTAREERDGNFLKVDGRLVYSPL